MKKKQIKNNHNCCVTGNFIFILHAFEKNIYFCKKCVNSKVSLFDRGEANSSYEIAKIRINIQVGYNLFSMIPLYNFTKIEVYIKRNFRN